MNASNGDGTSGNRPPAAPTDRIEAPLYLSRFRERLARARTDDGAETDAQVPMYLRRFRDRPEQSVPADAAQQPPSPLWQRASLGQQQVLTEDNRNKEISPPPGAHRTLLNDCYLIRHGETQGYSTDSGLTPQGSWQAHTYGQTLARRIKSGETVVFRHADTNRARETAEQVHRGLLDGLAQFEKDVKIVEPAPIDEFRNFQFAAPDGLKDVTAAFRQYYSMLETIERTAQRDRPLWLVEMDRFWRTQEGGGDPIQHWLTIPLIHFEPPSMCVRRFWAGLGRLSAEFPGARLAVATHSGPIRAFAVSALGYDPGEPYNTEHVRVKLYADRDSGQVQGDASVTYRNRVQDVKVPDIAALPTWTVHDEWSGLAPPS